MNQTSLAVAITSLSSSIEANTPEQQRALQTLHQQLATSVIDTNAVNLQGSSFSFENAESFQTTVAKNEASQAFQTSLQEALQNAGKPTQRVFVRDVPVRTAQIQTSVPAWAIGSAPDKTLGPFTTADGRQLWYDFYSIEELIALYVQGNSNPVLLFHISTLRRWFDNIPFVNQSISSYQLTGNTIWIYSQVFTKDAPSGYYTGLQISGGEISLSEVPQNINNQITVTAGATISLQLQLVQPAVTNADPTSDWGKDARAATLQLPQQLNFSFAGNNSAALQTISDAAWNVYGSAASFVWNGNAASFDALLREIMIPLSCSAQQFSVQNNLSSFNTLSGNANIEWSAWSLPIAQIDITQPTTAEGIGSLTIRCNEGLSSQWTGLQNGAVTLANPYIQASVGKLAVLDFAATNGAGTQEFILWKDALNPHPSTIEAFYNTAFAFLFLSDSAGTEIMIAQAAIVAHIDRPVTVDGHPLAIKTKNSALLISISQTKKTVYLYDTNILADNAPVGVIAYFPQSISFALQNAVFKTTKTAEAVLFGNLADDLIMIDNGSLYLSFGVYAYLPILPDPYAANLGILKQQFVGSDPASNRANQTVSMLLVCSIKWSKKQANANGDLDNVNVAFSFAPLPQQQQTSSSLLFNKSASNTESARSFLVQNQTFLQHFGETENSVVSSPQQKATTRAFQTEDVLGGLPDYQSIWDNNYGFFGNDLFALLDVSSHANQMGISFQANLERGVTNANNNLALYQTHDVTTTGGNTFPLQIEGMNVVSQHKNVKAFTLPQIAWEPVVNVTKPEKLGDPPLLYNYYPDDGGATRLFTNSVQLVPLAPIPVTHSLLHSYHHEQGNRLAAMFTLPFGLHAFAELDQSDAGQSQKPSIHKNEPSFEGKIIGGIQLKLSGGSVDTNKKVSNQFKGVTLQVNNILNLNGVKTNASTLGYDVTTIFNGEFYDKQGGVPLTRFDLSGYGASIFSNWQDKGAEFATTSQAEFEVFVGRTAHEVIQVKSLLYPWGIRVVRTITLFRAASGYEYRYDSGWKAESDGKFDFGFTPKTAQGSPTDAPPVVPYSIHPGTIEGLYNIKNIVAATDDIKPFTGTMDVNNWYDFDAFDKDLFPYSGGSKTVDIELDPVYFDADINIENTVQGSVNGLVSSKKILGFVQLLPVGIPLTPTAFAALLNYQNGSIGGPVNCVVDIGKNGEQMRVNRIDVNASIDASNTSPVFVAASRGNVVLPKDGSWSMVMHTASTGEVIPLPQGVTVPLIRIGEIDINKNFPTDGLLRIANPTELLRMPTNTTINFGYLQSTNTQKALFLTPAYQKLTDPTSAGTLFSKTPPLFADAYRLMNSKGIFLNIGDAVNNYGDAIALAENFATNAITDAGKQVLELMQINLKDAEGKVLQQGYKLLKQIETFDLPNQDWPIIDTSFFRIYVQYKAAVRNTNPIPPKPDGSPDYNNSSNFNDTGGLLNFDVNSFASNVADNWKSKLNNVSMAVDLGPFKPLLTIKGNFDAQNGSEAAYAGDDSNPDFPSPQLQFCKELDVIMDILQVLVSLQGGDYAAAMKKGLKIAMSNNADSWQYKFEAAQEIPLIEFPSDVVAGASAPLKIQASLKLGVYFNEALKVTTDPKQLLPTAGAFLEFYGKLSVMCVSLEAATVYAVGSADLKLAADTGVGPSLDMKFGFGAQIVVGLPVVGNVSVLYMIAVAVYSDAKTITVTASMLYQGRADLLGGLVDITITIEAQGSISRSGGQTTCEAQVTFAIDISIFLVIDIDFSKSWSEQRQIA